MNRRSVSFAAAALLSAFAAAVPLLSANGGEEYPELPRRITSETDEVRAERMAWWRHDRFGMFIHFGQSGDQKGALGGLVLPVKKPAVDCPVIECWLKQTNKGS